jgi:hypothetical protein
MYWFRVRERRPQLVAEQALRRLKQWLERRPSGRD